MRRSIRNKVILPLVVILSAGIGALPYPRYDSLEGIKGRVSSILSYLYERIPKFVPESEFQLLWSSYIAQEKRLKWETERNKDLAGLNRILTDQFRLLKEDVDSLSVWIDERIMLERELGRLRSRVDSLGNEIYKRFPNRNGNRPYRFGI